MVSLADLNTTPSTAPTLKDFSPWVTGQPTPSVVNEDTATNLAAHASLLAQPDQVGATFNNIKTELSTNSTSPTLTKVVSDRNTLDLQANYKELQNVLADPTVSPEDKASYMNGYVGLTTKPLPSTSLNTTIAKQAALTPSTSDETDEAIKTIVPSNGSIYDDVDRYNGWVQKNINLQKNANNDNWFTSAANVVESMLPFANQLGTAKTENAMGDIKNPGDLLKALTLLGNSKDAVRQSISTMPVKDRYTLAQNVLDAVKASGGSITGRPDTLNQIDQLNAFINGTGYSTKDKVSDNIFSLMDTLFFVSPLVKGLIKGPLEAVRAASALKRAALVGDAVQSAAPEVDDIVKPLLLTYDKPKPTVFVNRAGDASTHLPDVEPPSPDVVSSAHDMITDRIMAKFNKTDKNAKFYPGDNPDVNMASIRDDVHDKVASILTPNSYNDPDITKKIVDGVNETLKGRFIETPRTFKPTASQLVRQSFDDSNVARLQTRTAVDHLSVSQTVKDYNPEKARNIDQMMVDDTSGQAAKALYGTDRNEAIANDFLPEVENIDGSVRNKVNMDVGPQPDQRVIEAINKSKGRTDLTQTEKASTRSMVKQDFGDVVGMVPRTAMGTVGDSKLLVEKGSVDTSKGVDFSMVYGPKDGQFADKGQAVRQALFALRKYGVTPDEVEVLGKTPEGFVPAGDKNFDSYLVRVNHSYEFTPADTVERTVMSDSKWNIFDTRENWTDGKMGSLSQHFIPPSVTVPNTILNAASVAADKSAWYGKQLHELLASFGSKFKQLSKRQQALVDSYRVEANNKGLVFDVNNLKARGLNDKAIEAMKDWKTTTDTMWWLENVDANKTARNRGWSRFVNQTSDTDLLAKPVANSGFKDGVKVWDDQAGKMVVLKKSEVDELYARGGTIAKTRDVASHNGQTFDQIIVRNNSEGSYLRRVRDEDNTLPYRDGYYPIKYKNPIFIEQTLKNAEGETYKKVVASAGSLSDAKIVHERLLKANEGAVYNIRNDYKMGTAGFDEASWSYANSSGRSAQRVRGQQLEDATKITDPDHVHIESPEESLISSIRSVAQRTAFRDWVDTTKDRWMSQYGHLLEDQKGMKMWPEDARLIGRDKLQVSNLDVRNAKATWRYVRAMEGGYVNLLDDASKNFFKNFANIAGNKGWKWLETPLLAAARVNPVGLARRQAFRLLLAANPLRQALVQSSQALPVLLATNPLAIGKTAAQSILLDFMKNGGDADSWFKAITNGATGLDAKSAKQMFEDYHSAGFEAAVDANSLIRNQISSIVDRTWLGKAKALAAKPLNIGQKYGFNVGENTLMKTVWLSEYDLLKKTGVKIDAEALDNLSARVRNLTGNMNKAGELPYNENMFSAALQFFQMPHKTFSQILMGHKGLSGADRLKLGAAYVTTFGVGMSPITSMISNFIPGQQNLDPTTRELIEGGLFNLAMNSALTSIFHQTVKTDFSDSFRLLQFPDVFGFFNGLMANGVGATLGSGASVGLVIGDNARVTNFVKQLMRPFTVSDDKSTDELAMTAKAFGEMFSGVSNIFKAQYALEWQKSINARGGVVDYHVNSIEAVLKGLGFSTIDEIHQYAANNASYAATQQYKNDIAHIVDQTSRLLAREGVSNEEAGWYMDMMAEAQRVYKGDPIYMNEFSNQIIYKARTNENSIFETLLKQSGFVGPQQFTDLVNMSHLNDDAKKILLDSKAQFEEMKNDAE